jgi:hypothetical protein
MKVSSSRLVGFQQLDKLLRFFPSGNNTGIEWGQELIRAGHRSELKRGINYRFYWSIWGTASSGAVECFFRNYGTSFRFIVELEAQTCVVISIIPNKEGNKF